MHPDRRRRGRAIRKQRRLAREKWGRLTAAVAEAGKAFGPLVEAFGEFASTVRTFTVVTQGSSTVSTTPGPEAGRPSQSGVTRASEAHSPVLSDSFKRADGPVGGDSSWTQP